MTFKVQDHYFKKAKKENFMARSVYKLEEIDQKCKILRKNDHVIDLGYYPGSWVQYASPIVGPEGKVVGIDTKDVNSSLRFPNVTLFQKDILDVKSLDELGVKRPFDVVLSDMAPNMSGVGLVDQARAMDLAELALAFALEWLKPGGSFLVKVFMGSGFEDLVRNMRAGFEKVETCKPKASRDRSAETYLLGVRRKAKN